MADQPVSQRIRARLEARGQRFHANDNIAEFIEPGELDLLTREVEAKMAGVLESLVIDMTHDHNTQDTARRVAKMYVNEVFRGRYVPRPKVTEFPNAEHLNELMIMGPVTVRSACSHHLCPIMGRLWIGVMPNQDSDLIGLSKYSRLCEWIMSRPQIQEEADHFCMHWRGVKDNASKMTNSVMRGVFLDNGALRREFLSLINLKS
jgi:GTP cyclohydrolase I